MNKLQGSGAIGMLLALLIIAILFIIMMPNIKTMNSNQFYKNSINSKSVEDHVNKQLEDIKNMRQQTIQYNNNEY